MKKNSKAILLVWKCAVFYDFEFLGKLTNFYTTHTATATFYSFDRISCIAGLIGLRASQGAEYRESQRIMQKLKHVKNTKTI